MQIIDSIMELARSMEPARNENVDEFSLVFKKGEWRATVLMPRGTYCDYKANTPEEALKGLNDELIKMNESFANRFSERVRRFVFGNTRPKLVKPEKSEKA